MGASSPITAPSGQQSGVHRARKLSEQQFGAIARWQLRRVGFSEARVRSWIRSGRLHRRYPGVYAWGRPELGAEGQLAAGLLYAGTGAALGGLTCLWWMELLNHRPSLIHIDASGTKSSSRDLIIRHPRTVTRTWHRGLPVVPLPQTLLAAAAHLRHDSLRLVLARADFHHLLSLSSLQAALGEGRRGSSAVHAAMDAHLPQLARCASGLERDFVLLCEHHRLPLPEPNERIARFRPDMLWREAKLIVELDGRGAHNTPAQSEADTSRQAELERLGFTVLRFSWAQLRSAPQWVAAGVRRHLGVFS